MSDLLLDYGILLVGDPKLEFLPPRLLFLEVDVVDYFLPLLHILEER